MADSAGPIRAVLSDMLTAVSVPGVFARPSAALVTQPRVLQTAARRLCIKRSRAQLTQRRRLQACQSIPEDREAPGMATTSRVSLPCPVLARAERVVAADSQPESPDSTSRRSLQVTFTCNKCGVSSFALTRCICKTTACSTSICASALSECLCAC